MFESVDLQEASRDAQRALEEERDRCVDRVAELDGYLKVMDMVNDLIAENERLKEDLESMRDDGHIWTTSLNVGVNCAKKEMKIRFWEDDNMIYHFKW